MLFSTVWSVEFIDFVETLLLNGSFHSFVTVKSLSNDAVLRGILFHPSCYSMSGIIVSFSGMYLKIKRTPFNISFIWALPDLLLSLCL